MRMFTFYLFFLSYWANAQITIDFDRDTLLLNQEVQANGELRLKNFFRSTDPTLRFIPRAGNQIVGVSAREIQKCWEALPAGTDSVNFTIKLTNNRQLPSPVSKTLPSIFDLQIRFAHGTPPPAKSNTFRNTPATILPSGLPFFDAVQLAQAEQAGDKEAYQQILAAYGQDSGNQNPFLPAFNAFTKQNNRVATSLIGPNGGSAEAGLTATAVADALARFIAKRFKEELNIAYLNEFKKKLIDIKELGLLLPETQRLLLDTDPYAYTTFLKSLQETSQNDLHNAPENTIALLDSDVMWDRVKQKGETPIAFYGTSLAVLQTATLVYRGDKTAIALGKLDKVTALRHITDKPMGATLRLLAVLARNFSTPQGDFVKREDFNAYANPKVIQYFLGLMLEKEKAVLSSITMPNNGGNIYSLLTNQGSAFINGDGTIKIEALKAFQAHLNNLVNRYQAIRDVREAASSGQETPGGIVRRTLTASLDLVESAIDVSVMIPGLAIPPDVKTKYLPLARSVITLVQAVQEKQYGMVLTSAITVSVQINSINTGANDFIPAGIRQKMIEYGTFVVTLVNAKDSDEMAAALEAAALPVGSYRIKRNSPFSISLNAYAGLFGANEKFDDVKKNGSNDALNYGDARSGFAWGATAPVGIAFNWGGIDDRFNKSEPAKDFSSVSIFLPLIDVGGVFAFRLQDNVSTLPELSWKNILAPGVGLIYGFRNSPLVLSAFTQYGPQLRKVTVDGNEYQPSTWRYGLSLTADIPIFNLFTRKQVR